MARPGRHLRRPALPVADYPRDRVATHPHPLTDGLADPSALSDRSGPDGSEWLGVSDLDEVAAPADLAHRLPLAISIGETSRPDAVRLLLRPRSSISPMRNTARPATDDLQEVTATSVGGVPECSPLLRPLGGEYKGCTANDRHHPGPYRVYRSRLIDTTCGPGSWSCPYSALYSPPRDEVGASNSGRHPRRSPSLLKIIKVRVWLYSSIGLIDDRGEEKP